MCTLFYEGWGAERCRMLDGMMLSAGARVNGIWVSVRASRMLLGSGWIGKRSVRKWSEAPPRIRRASRRQDWSGHEVRTNLGNRLACWINFEGSFACGIGRWPPSGRIWGG